MSIIVDEKEKFTIEYTLRSVSFQLLWNYLSTPQGLGRWFADDADQNQKTFTFYWNRNAMKADMVAHRTGIFIRFRWWDDMPSRVYFEFRLSKVELTGDTILEITDFAYPDEKEDAIDLWDKQIAELKRGLGL